MFSAIVFQAQVPIELYYNKYWDLTVKDSARFIRKATYNLTTEKFTVTVEDFYANGTIQMKGTYTPTREGEFTLFYDNGIVESTGEYKNKARVGNWKYFYRNGTPKAEVKFIDDWQAMGDPICQ